MTKQELNATTEWLTLFDKVMQQMPSTLKIAWPGEIRLNLSETNETCCIVKNKDQILKG